MYLFREGSSNTDNSLFLNFKECFPNKDKKLLFFPEIRTGKWFFDAGIPEKNLIEWCVVNFAKSDKVFLDIGAHVGTYTLNLAPKAKKVYSFECNPKVFCHLAANVELHDLTDKVQLYQFGLGNETKSVPYMIRREDGGGNGVKSLGINDSCLSTHDIIIYKLDDLYGFGESGTDEIGFIKIDVEGFEKEVLQGAKATLVKNNFPPILFESWGEWKDRELGSTGDVLRIRKELFDYIQEIGYKINEIQGIRDMFLATK
jgi:FkbM family methyltransferase